MQVKCEARILGISSIELKKKKETNVGTVAVDAP
jgi:hypothetical protein